MTKSETRGVLKALDTLYWKTSYFGGMENWNYIAAELSNLLPMHHYFAWDKKKERAVVLDARKEKHLHI